MKSARKLAVLFASVITIILLYNNLPHRGAKDIMLNATCLGFGLVIAVRPFVDIMNAKEYVLSSLIREISRYEEIRRRAIRHKVSHLLIRIRPINDTFPQIDPNEFNNWKAHQNHIIKIQTELDDLEIELNEFIAFSDEARHRYPSLLKFMPELISNLDNKTRDDKLPEIEKEIDHARMKFDDAITLHLIGKSDAVTIYKPLKDAERALARASYLHERFGRRSAEHT